MLRKPFERIVMIKICTESVEENSCGIESLKEGHTEKYPLSKIISS
jgi:hypothetical protein